MAATADKIDFINRDDIIGMIDGEFAKLDPDYTATKRMYQAQIEPLKQRVLESQDAGNPVWRSQQILSEAIWLNHYTLDWPRLRARVDDLQCSLEPGEIDRPDQRDLSPSEDGGYYHGTEDFLTMLDLTTDAVQRDDAPKVTLEVLKPYLEPARLLGYLHGLQITDIAAGKVNHRSELATAESCFSQFLIKPKLRRLLSDPKLWDGKTADDIALALRKLSETYEDFLNQTQHPRTGFWGPWYRFGDRLLQMHDLSFTFHVVRYRKGEVAHLSEIVDTTLEIGRLGLSYPYGWKPSDHPSPYSNHHNTDAITLFKYAVDTNQVNESQTKQIATVVYDMLDWCLTRSLMSERERPYCGFVEVDEYNTIQKFGFGVDFLQLSGFFDVGQRFWWDPSRDRAPGWPDPHAVASGLLAAVDALRVDSSFTDDIREVLTPLAERQPAPIGAQRLTV